MRCSRSRPSPRWRATIFTALASPTSARCCSSCPLPVRRSTPASTCPATPAFRRTATASALGRRGCRCAISARSERWCWWMGGAGSPAHPPPGCRARWISTRCRRASSSASKYSTMGRPPSTARMPSAAWSTSSRGALSTACASPCRLAAISPKAMARQRGSTRSGGAEKRAAGAFWRASPTSMKARSTPRIAPSRRSRARSAQAARMAAARPSRPRGGSS